MERLTWQELAPKSAASDEGTTLKVEISNISPEQAEAFKKLFAWMNYWGSAGCSRSSKLNYDGDGSARARITVDGEEVKPSDEDKESNPDSTVESFGFE